MDIIRMRRLHRWSSLVSGTFLLIACLTGLPLIFKDEIDGAQLSNTQAGTQTICRTPDLDCMVVKSQQNYPGEFLRWIVFTDTEVAVTMTPSWDANRDKNHWIKYSLDDGHPTGASGEGARETGFLSFVSRLHTDLFAGLLGELILAVAATAVLVATLTGLALYRPFVYKLRFGEIRVHRRRTRWLDFHNLLGISTLVWVCVVAATGAVNALSTPLFGWWRMTELAAMTAHYPNIKNERKKASPPLSLEKIVRDLQRTMPEHKIFSIVYPSPGTLQPYYLLWLKGREPLTSRMYTPILVNGQSGRIDLIGNLPWYLRLLEISRPLHFGDYGNLPLKIIWSIYDIFAIMVLASGVYLWLARGSKTEGGRST
jgi:uncharacterized iron-regulated membrane protein